MGQTHLGLAGPNKFMISPVASLVNPGKSKVTFSPDSTIRSSLYPHLSPENAGFYEVKHANPIDIPVISINPTQ
jgi:hypothetical protein